MIVDITKCAYQRGYLPKIGIAAFHPFFPTSSAAFRREALLKTGAFDLRCQTGEDVDLSIRLVKAGYELWYEPAARIRHFGRHTLGHMCQQWFGYGRGHAYLYKKHLGRPRLQFYRYDLSQRRSEHLGIRCVLDLPLPVCGMIFLSSFHLFHLALLVALMAGLLGGTTVAAAACLVAVLAAGWYVSRRFDWRRPLRSLVMSGLRYLADCAYTLGGLAGGLREGVLYLEATRSWKRPVSH